MSLPELEKEKISTRMIDRLAYSRDASVYRLVPRAVIRPENEQDIIAILKNATREKIPVTFRTGGTSLSGQAVTDGYLVESLRGWREFSILNEGKQIRVQPGLTGAYVNGLLRNFGRKIGPDPASIKAARIGGIVANNASGMACGVSGNSYHTIESIRFILSNGNSYDTANPKDYQRFKENEQVLHEGLLTIRKHILDSKHLTDRIRNKYRIKNTIGYSMNSFIDFDNALDIFSHLLVGSEGTLAFISDVTFNTLPDPELKRTDLFIFNTPEEACGVIPDLKQVGPSSVELMDKASLHSSKYIKDLTFDLSGLGPTASALLVEFQGEDKHEILDQMIEAEKAIKAGNGKAYLGWQEDEIIRSNLWALRKGLYPTVGSFRSPRTSVITEDLCYDINDLAEAVKGLQRIFKNNGTRDAVIFGHAQDGNLHFVASTDLNDKNAAVNFGRLMKDLVDMTLGQFDGSLKGEHGTGRNMAPFVEMEWGSDLYAVMQRVKVLADPNNILNPGVILNGGNETIHLENLKTMPNVNKEVDLCVECGFCETVCPSRDLTLTPRQRIIVLRELEQQIGLTKRQTDQIRSEFNYSGLDTCAVDGLCELSCPVNINTGEMVSQYRQKKNSRVKNELASLSNRYFKYTSSLVRFSLEVGKLSARNMSLMKGINQIADRLPFRIPRISLDNPLPADKLPETTLSKGDPDLIYFPTCLTRTMSSGRVSGNLANEILEIGRIAGKSMIIPVKVDKTCCGVPYHSKGYMDVNLEALTNTVDLLYKASSKGKTPVIVDTSPCTGHLKKGNEILTGEMLEKWKTLTYIDINEFLWEVISETSLEKLDLSIAVHPTCSTEKMGQTQLMSNIAGIIARKAEISPNWNCCAFAGDRGIWFPELTKSATTLEAEEIIKGQYDIGVSSSRTCEAGMERATGIEFRPLASLVLKYLKQLGK